MRWAVEGVTGPPSPTSELFDAEQLPEGTRLLEEGATIGARIRAGRSKFCVARAVASEVEWKRSLMVRGELEWSMIMGLASLEEQVDALVRLDEYAQRTGVVIDRGLVIPNWVTGLPERLRERAPRGTSFVLGGTQEHVALAQAAPIMPCFNDWHIGSPAAVENTIAAIEAGGNYMGVLAQFVWDLPYVESDIDTVADNVRAIAIAAQKVDDGVVVDSYMDDGMPAHFADNASLVGYARLERYVVEELCGARYATGFGQLISDIPTKISIWLALHRVLNHQHPSLSYLYGNTLDASDSVIAGNFGISAAETVAFAAVERRYRTGIALLPNPATEALQVPTVAEIEEVHAVARAAASKAIELEDLFDFRGLEESRDELVSTGLRFYENILAGLADTGVNVRDPFQVLLGIRRIGAARLENLFHPGARDERAPNGIVPVSPTEFTRRIVRLADEELERVYARALGEAVAGRTFLVGSSDTHAYGMYVLERVLRALRAEVVELGVDLDPEDVAARVRGRGGRLGVAISSHNGQCLPYVRRLVALLADREGTEIFVGGKLNYIAPGASEPSDVTGQLREAGAVPCAQVVDLVAHFARPLS